MITIRPATTDDVSAITDIYNEAILQTTATFDTEPKSIDEQLEWFASHGDRHPVLVAADADGVQGWASLSPWSSRCAYAETAETSMYVRSEYRRRGIGRQLKAAIIQAAVELGYHTLIAQAAEGSDASLHLNRSFGFQLVGTLKKVGNKFGRRLDVIIMQLMLKSAADESPPD